MSDNDIGIKLFLLGDSQVGKSSFIERYVDGSFSSDASLTTIGCDVKKKNVYVDVNHKAEVEIWDTAGQERFRSITSNMIKGAEGILLLYDITSQPTFADIKQWMESIKEKASENIPVVLVGNKVDLENKRTVSTSDGNNLAQKYNIQFFEASCMNDVNVNESFKALIKLVYKFKKTQKVESKPNNTFKTVQNKVERQPEKKKCC